MAKTPTWQVGILIPKELLKRDTNAWDGPAWSITLRPVIVGNHPSEYSTEIKPEQITNPTDRTRYNGLFLNGLEIYAWAKQEKDGKAKIWHYEYRFDVFKVDRQNVFALAKTIKTIDARMDKLTARDGYPRDFVDFLRRLTVALKVTTFVQPMTDLGWSYSENEHRFSSTGDGLNVVAHKIEQWRRSVEEPAAETLADHHLSA